MRGLRAEAPMHNRPRAPRHRWEHEHVLEAVQERLDKNPEVMRVRRQTAEHPFGTLKAGWEQRPF